MTINGVPIPEGVRVRLVSDGGYHLWRVGADGKKRGFTAYPRDSAEDIREALRFITKC